MKVTIAQLRCDADDSTRRHAMIDDAFAVAGDAQADLLVLPELALSGYRLHRGHLSSVAEPGDGRGPGLSRWRAQAARYDVAVIGGFPELLPNGRLANSAVVIGPDGEVAGCYQKLHRFAAEVDVFEGGSLGLPMFELAGARVGVAICYDLRFPEVVRILAARGADLIAIPTAWVEGFDRPAPDAEIGQVVGARVQANLSQVVLACADQIGRQDDHRFLGRSVVVGPFGDSIVGPLSPDRPAVVTADLDLDEIRHAANRAPGVSPRRQRRTDVYDSLLGYKPVTESATTATQRPEVPA